MYDGGGRAEVLVRLLWRIDLALSGSRGQSVEEVGSVCGMYKAQVTGRACHGREEVYWQQ